MITIVGCNKGGASKTTTATNIAVALAKAGRDVVLVDADPQRTAAKWHAEREASGISPAFPLIEKRDNITSAIRALAEKFEHVVVDVAGRNSRELITGCVVADVLLAPHQCSQFDLDTLEELQEQVAKIRDLNPDLRVLVYHAMASTNPSVKGRERAEFAGYLAEFPEFELLDAVGYYRKAYKDAASEGRSVLETSNGEAASEIDALVREVYRG
ncbi:AAA family ATPase [Pseudomonas aeruginosa]|uniref:AAA family ATPase n=1 Tax=Pseudomonas aeruginosa TaxID=287 RepID=UPI001C9E06F3|nr:AAA family ATPase [Pseudomonas aeruginosa]MBY9724440.1 AAA family ATPase [Pseudomonas aeruginosa]QZV52270.1 AAA family ATPase [Pseudomonas aeruginosa]HCF3656516.1 AAA family ATPase [Pseudomonas aeruginosa]